MIGIGSGSRKAKMAYKEEIMKCHVSQLASVPDPYVLGLPDPDPFVRGTDPDPSIIKQKYEK
jgi:hypothetical protein